LATRHDGRRPDQLRELDVQPDFLEQPHGSVLYAQGRTVVLCTATIEQDIPRWLKGKGQGWMTAEYALLPASTGQRTQRGVTRGRPDGRTVEIQRLIGRALRGVCDFKALGERTLWLDCDVLQADGGTRTLSVTGGFLALADAVASLSGKLPAPQSIFRTSVAAISLGLVDDRLLLDLDYSEDSRAQVDCNIVMTGAGEFVEIQGTAEGRTFTQAQLDAQLQLARKAIAQITALQREALGAAWPL
jgi:ribonuclease PH